MQVAHSLDEVHQDICREEGKQEPKRTIAESQAAYLPTELSQSCYSFIHTFGEEAKPTERNDAPDDAPREVGHK